MGLQQVAHVLAMLAEYADILGEPYRHRAFLEARAQVLAHPDTYQEHLTDKMQARVAEILATGTCEEMRERDRDPKIQTYKKLLAVQGAGRKAVDRWWDLGIRSVDELLTRPDAELTLQQWMGAKHYADLILTIPKIETEALGRYIARVTGDIAPDAKVEIVGSYRRGTLSQGDVDILVTLPEPDADFYDRLVEEVRYTAAFVSVISQGKEKMTMLLRGFHDTVRQVDVLLTTPDHHAAALLYFTGPASHNEWLRGIAKKYRMKLNEHGLFREGVVEPTKTEAEIYQHLGLKWIAPRLRSS